MVHERSKQVNQGTGVAKDERVVPAQWLTYAGPMSTKKLTQKRLLHETKNEGCAKLFISAFDTNSLSREIKAHIGYSIMLRHDSIAQTRQRSSNVNPGVADTHLAAEIDNEIQPK